MISVRYHNDVPLRGRQGGVKIGILRRFLELKLGRQGEEGGSRNPKIEEKSFMDVFLAVLFLVNLLSCRFLMLVILTIEHGNIKPNSIVLLCIKKKKLNPLLWSKAKTQN